MLKEPRPGRVKTRLAKGIGTTAATWWFRHQSRNLIRRLTRDPRWVTIAAVSPDTATGSRMWASDMLRLPQGCGDLGARMKRAMLSAPTGPVLVIGADIPGVTSAHIWRAFQALGGADVVLGPAPDGGYWLVGVKHSAVAKRSGFLEGVRWSTQTTMADTIKSLGPSAKVTLTDTLDDVDTIEDLKRWQTQRCSASP